MSSPSMALSWLAAVAVTGTASANFAGFTVTSTVTPAGNTQFKVFATFSTANNVVLNVFNVNRTAGSLNASLWCNDLDRQECGWLPQGSSQQPSYVTICGGTGVALDPGNPGDSTRLPSGWYDSTPGTSNTASTGMGGGLFGCLIAQVTQSALSTCTHTASVTYKVAGSTIPLSGSGTFTVPAPGALTTLLAAGTLRRRRRR